MKSNSVTEWRNFKNNRSSVYDPLLLLLFKILHSVIEFDFMELFLKSFIVQISFLVNAHITQKRCVLDSEADI